MKPFIHLESIALKTLKFLFAVECIRDNVGHFARVLYESMAGVGTKDDSLIRCVVWRSEIDMLQIKQHFERVYKQPLGKMIAVC